MAGDCCSPAISTVFNNVPVSGEILATAIGQEVIRVGTSDIKSKCLWITGKTAVAYRKTKAGANIRISGWSGVGQIAKVCCGNNLIGCHGSTIQR